MRVPPEVEELIEEGAALSAEGAAALERGLEGRPGDLDARARLLGYYGARDREAYAAATMEERLALGRRSLLGEMSPHQEARARHALWLAAHAPRAPLVAHPMFHFSTIDPAYGELSAIWRQHIAAGPPDATLLAHAIGFFWHANETFAEELLGRAEQAFPDDARWIHFRQKRRAHELSMAHRLQRLEPSDARAATLLDEVRALLGEADPLSDWVPEMHEVAAQLALSLDRIDAAREHAEHLLVSAVGAGERERGDDAHNGHLLLGLVALRGGDVERAKAHLVLAGRVGATGLVPIFGPDLRLARELLARGERDAVIRYLTLCRAFWQRGPIDDWIAEIQTGGLPNLIGR
jgi:hypothetical protein